MRGLRGSDTARNEGWRGVTRTCRDAAVAAEMLVMSREGAKAGYIGDKGGSETVGTAAVGMHHNVKKWAPQDEKPNFRSAALERIGHGTDGGAKSGCDLSDILTGLSLLRFLLECRELIDEASVGLEPRSAPDEVDGALHVQDDCRLLVGRSHCAVLDGLQDL